MNQIDEDNIDDDDDFDAYDDEDDYDYELLNEDEWEDHPGYQRIKAAMPPGWYIVKLINFSWRDMAEMDQWCADNCRAAYKRVGFTSGCSTKVAVQFEDLVDATYFKLRWR